jgi:flavin-dependent dehydrogenase
MWHVGGAGIAGSYLYRRMQDSGIESMIHDPRVENFYIPCGFATNKHLIIPYLSKVSVDLGDILETEASSVTVKGNNFQETEFRPSGLCTINKMELEKKILGNGEITRSTIKGNDGNIVDATGISRGYLGKIPGDLSMYAVEKVCRESPFKGFHFNFFKNGNGYFWSFPLKDRYHIGAGGVNLDEVQASLAGYQGERVLSRKIRMKPTMGNIVNGNIIGVGESIGYISPLLGEGIVPALESAEKLFQAISRYDDFESITRHYGQSISGRMKVFNDISIMVSNIQHGKTLNLHNILTARKALSEVKNFGMNPDFYKIFAHFLSAGK